MVLVRLPEWLIAAARVLGDGNMSAGVRRALELAAGEKIAAGKLDGLE
jgi:hypothetical protein